MTRTGGVVSIMRLTDKPAKKDGLVSKKQKGETRNRENWNDSVVLAIKRREGVFEEYYKLRGLEIIEESLKESNKFGRIGWMVKRTECGQTDTQTDERMDMTDL